MGRGQETVLQGGRILRGVVNLRIARKFDGENKKKSERS